MWNPDIYQETMNFAAQAHGFQPMPGRETSYLHHVACVTMETLAAYFYKQNFDINFAMQCALLHDVIEDTKVTYQEIEKTFGKKIADGVLALSKNPDLEKSVQMTDSLQRIKLQPIEVWNVKLADRISNLQKPNLLWNSERRKQYLSEAQFIFDTLKGANEYLEKRLIEKMAIYPQYF